MIICDRHYKKDGSVTPAVETLYIGPADTPYERIELCASCAAALRDFVNQPAPAPIVEEDKPGPGRPRKTDKKP